MEAEKRKRLRIGVIGCGRISDLYQEVFRILKEQIEVVIAIDKRVERAERFAESFPGCASATSVEELISYKPEIVHILTPHFLHAQQTITCLQAGIHVLVEKPIAITLSSARDMIKVADQTGRKLAVISQNRFIEGITEIKRQMSANELGELKGVWSTLHWFRPASYYACDWKGRWETEGGGVVMDQAIHSLDLVRYVIGKKVVSIQAHIDRRVRTEIEVEDVADAVITFENGVRYSFFATNYHVTNSPIEIEFLFEKGTAKLVGQEVIIQKQGEEELRIRPKGRPLMGLSYWGDYHLHQIQDFYEAVRHDKQPHFAPMDAVETLEMVLGIYQSAKENKIWKK